MIGQIIDSPAVMRTGQITKTPVTYVLIAGNRVHATEWRTTHDVHRGIGSASVVLPKTMLPFINWHVPLSIMVGYLETGMGYVFVGTVSGMRESFGENGPEYIVEAEGPLSALIMPRKADVTYMSLRTVRAIIANEVYTAGIRGFEADMVLYPDAREEIVLGGNPFVNQGYVPVSRGSVPWTFVQRLANLFGYRIFDRPDGIPRLQRVSGEPTSPTRVLQQGVNVLDIQRVRENRSNANYWIIRGARWSDQNGVLTQAISQPAQVPSSGYYLGGWKLEEPPADDLIVNNRVARAVRHVREANDSIPSDTVTIQTEGTYDLMPGEVVQVHANDVRITNAQNRWVTRVSHSWGEDGFWTTLDAWTGGGEVLSGGSDIVELLVAPGIYHLGAQSKSNYAKPTPDGTLVSLHFNVPEDYLSLYLTARTHGANSVWRERAGQEAGQRWPEHVEARDSRIEILQQNDVVATVTLPMFYEALNDSRDFSDDGNWHNVRLPISGRLQPGVATVRIHSAQVEQRGITNTIDILNVERNYHLGQESKGNYLKPAPDTVQLELNVTLPQYYKSMYLTARTHGANSLWRMRKNENDLWEPEHVRSSGSKVELWQGGRMIANATLPYFYEPYQDARPFSDDMNWHNIRLNLNTNIYAQPGPATLRFLTATTTQKSMDAGGDDIEIRDNYEIKNIVLTVTDDSEQGSVIYDNFEIKNLRITASGVPTTWVSQ